MQPYSHLYFADNSGVNSEKQAEGLRTIAKTLIVLYKTKLSNKDRRRFDEVTPQPQGIGRVRIEP